MTHQPRPKPGRLEFRTSPSTVPVCHRYTTPVVVSPRRVPDPLGFLGTWVGTSVSVEGPPPLRTEWGEGRDGRSTGFGRDD